MFLSGTVPPRSFPSPPSSHVFLHLTLVLPCYTPSGARLSTTYDSSVRALHYRVVRISFASSIFFIRLTLFLPATYSFLLFSLSRSFVLYLSSILSRSTHSRPLTVCSSRVLFFLLPLPSRRPESRTYATRSRALTRVSCKNSPRDPPISAPMFPRFLRLSLAHYTPAAISGSSRGKYLMVGLARAIRDSFAPSSLARFWGMPSRPQIAIALSARAT